MSAEGKAPEGVASVELTLTRAPTEGARVTSPLTLEGTAPADWFREGQFRAQLLNPQGVVMAEAPALRGGNSRGAANFSATLVFEVDVDTRATVLLQEDLREEGARPREHRIPVLLARRT
jgi:hypothetical protein